MFFELLGAARDEFVRGSGDKVHLDIIKAQVKTGMVPPRGTRFRVRPLTLKFVRGFHRNACNF